jgi:hypothetical protein
MAVFKEPPKTKIGDPWRPVFTPIFVKGIFELPSPRNARKRD